MDDMSWIEDLTAKYRSLTYDFDRMRSLHREEVEKAANAEREMNLYKSKLAASHKSFRACENMQKQTAFELQKTRTLMQGIRATHLSELKKKEKDIERINERWQKISDLQYKLNHSQSGLKCANVAVVEGEQVGRRGLGFLDIALEQSEQARNHLKDENAFLRKWILKTVNELKSALHTSQWILRGHQGDEAPLQMDMTTLFVPPLPTAVSDKINSIVDSLHQNLSALREAYVGPTAVCSLSENPEVIRLQSVVTKLKAELALSREQATVNTTEAQNLFDKYTAGRRLPTEENGEMSVELMSPPMRDEEKERLEKLRVELDSDRRRFTEAAIKLCQERAAHEAECIRFLEEKRSWEVEKMLGDFPASPPSPPQKSTNVLKPSPHTKSTRLSPRKSPRKPLAKVGKASKVLRLSRMSLSSPGEVTSYETELVLPPAFPILKPFVPSSSSLLPTSFVLPPPSPRASLPIQPVLASIHFDSSPDVNRATDKADNLPSTVPPPIVEKASVNTIIPTTPGPRQPFPVAKPFAQRMIHAYSPARPSPLSRILMLASPTTPPKDSQAKSPLSPISEPTEGDSRDSLERALGISAPTLVPSTTIYEIGDSASDKHVVPKDLPSPGRHASLFAADPKKRDGPAPRTKILDEKENRNSVKPAFSKAVSTGAMRKAPSATSRVVKSPSKAIKPTKTASNRKGKMVARPISVGGGPRRVPINSVDAPPITDARK